MKKTLILLLFLISHFSFLISSLAAQNDTAYWDNRFRQLLRWTYIDDSLANIYLNTELNEESRMKNEESADAVDPHPDNSSFFTPHSSLNFTQNSQLKTQNYLPLHWYGYSFQPSDLWPVVFHVAVGDGPEQTLTLAALQQLAQWGAFLTNDDHRRLRLEKQLALSRQRQADSLLRRQLDSLDNLARALRIEADSLSSILAADSLASAREQMQEEVQRTKQRMNRDQIFILNVNTARSEYMFGLELNLYNPFGKTISMLEFNVAPYNDRGQVQEDKFHRTVRTMRCMGPIAPEAPAQYTFDELFWNDRGRIKYMRINSITFHFTDGTSRSFRGYEKILKHTLR